MLRRQLGMLALLVVTTAACGTRVAPDPSLSPSAGADAPLETHVPAEARSRSGASGYDVRPYPRPDSQVRCNHLDERQWGFHGQAGGVIPAGHEPRRRRPSRSAPCRRRHAR